MSVNEERTAKIFKALCDPKRVSIIKLLQLGNKCACNITDELGIAQSALSYHMKILCESGLVECEYVGKWTHYQISDAGSEFAINLLKELTMCNPEKSCSCNHNC